MAHQADWFSQVNKPKDPSHPNELEKGHVPVIIAPDKVRAGECFEVTAEVAHVDAPPNQHTHFIEFAELYAGEVYLGRMDFTADTPSPTLKACVSLPKGIGPLRAFARCNLHGVWTASKEIAVTA